MTAAAGDEDSEAGAALEEAPTLVVEPDDEEDLIGDQGEGASRVERYKALVSKQELVLRAIQLKTRDYDDGARFEPASPIRRDDSVALVGDLIVERERRVARFDERRRSMEEDAEHGSQIRAAQQEDARTRREQLRREHKEEQQRRFFAVHSRAKEFHKARKEMERERERYVEAWYARWGGSKERFDRDGVLLEPPGQRSPASPSAPRSPAGRSLSSPLSPPTVESGRRSPTSSAGSPKAARSPRALLATEAVGSDDVYKCALKSHAFYASTMERWESVVAQNDKRCAAYWQKISGDKESPDRRRSSGDRSRGGGSKVSTTLERAGMEAHRPGLRPAGAASRAAGNTRSAVGAPAATATEDEPPPLLSSRCWTLKRSRGLASLSPQASLSVSLTPSALSPALYQQRLDQCLKHWEQREEHALRKWGNKSEALLEARIRLDAENKRRSMKAGLYNQQWEEKSAASRLTRDEPPKRVSRTSVDFHQASSLLSSPDRRASTAGADQLGTRPQGSLREEMSERVRANATKLKEDDREKHIEKWEAKMARCVEVQDLVETMRQERSHRTAKHAERLSVACKHVVETDQEMRQKAQQSIQKKSHQLQGFQARQSMSFLEKRRTMRKELNRTDPLEQVKDIPVPQGNSWTVDSTPKGDEALTGERALGGGTATVVEAALSRAKDAPESVNENTEQAFFQEIERRSEKWLKVQ